MGGRLLLVLGWYWPFVVAGTGVAAIAAGYSLRSDSEVTLLFVAALLGSPAVVVTIAGWLPAAWSAESRHGLAILLALPILAFEFLVALYLFVHGANAAAPGWIE